jgi:hypothetical protein
VKEFELYDNHPKAGEAEKEGRALLDKFVEDVKEWQERFHEAGASDTASRQAFREAVAEELP